MEYVEAPDLKAFPQAFKRRIVQLLYRDLAASLQRAERLLEGAPLGLHVDEKVYRHLLIGKRDEDAERRLRSVW